MVISKGYCLIWVAGHFALLDRDVILLELRSEVADDIGRVVDGHAELVNSILEP